MSAPVIFVLGAGPGIGLSVGKAFAAKGYKVALAARSFQEGVGEDGFLRLKLDLAKTEEVQAAYTKVTKQLGIPSVVVYNGADRIVLDENDPLEAVTLEDVNRQFAVNSITPLFVAKEAVKGFKQLPSSASKTFIFTGNKLNVLVWPLVTTFGMGKNATAYLIKAASQAYDGEGFRFYYCDERQEDGGISNPPDGDAAAEEYIRLAEKSDQGPPINTFVKGKGYVKFD
ncbi:NAD(P)-binding protein [Microthyrium microscopicum]|uniref:NAD(P)-binding protein n=1 Tax=Microthyrium microscopicum TaxID=703497 RepID=A0A6A6UK90_9PEZI|nr:NAD(P)-binding protein [Microthyrium microscopicum]